MQTPSKRQPTPHPVADPPPPAPDDAQAPGTGPERLRERERLRLMVELLDDDSPIVVSSVRAALSAAGRRAQPGLAAATSDARPRLRGRARELLASMQRRGVLRRLLGYAAGGAIDLERGLWLISSLDRSAFDARPYRKALDAMAAEVKRRIAGESDPGVHPLVLIRYLGKELGYAGDSAEFDHPHNVFLHRAIERRRGMPLTLSALYLFVARRAGLRAGILALPGHVMLRLRGGPRSIIVDPFHGGRLRTRADCLKRLAQQGRLPSPESFREASDGLLFQRQLLNLMSSFHRRGKAAEARALHRIATVVGRAQLDRAERTA